LRIGIYVKLIILYVKFKNLLIQNPLHKFIIIYTFLGFFFLLMDGTGSLNNMILELLQRFMAISYLLSIIFLIKTKVIWFFLLRSGLHTLAY